MRSAEGVVVWYLAWVLALAWATRRPARVRAIATGVAAADGAALWWLATAAPPVVRDWAPVVQILICYWLSGLFFERPMPAVEAWLLRTDGWMYRRLGLAALAARGPRVVLEGLEAAYLGVFALVPAGFAVALAADPGLDVNRYWTVVLAAELGCYAAMPFVQTRTPRALGDRLEIDARAGLVRRATSVVRRGSIGVNTFPSGHTAGAVATALVAGAVWPAAGIVFGALAAAVAVGSIVGRYHYGIDALLGAVAAVLAFGLLGGAAL